MTTPSKFYDPDQMAKVATLYKRVKDAIEEFEGGSVGIPTAEHPLYVFGMEMVIRHRDDYTIGRIGMDDFPYFELTDERYGEKPKS